MEEGNDTNGADVTVGTTEDFIVNPEGNFASNWIEKVDEDVRGSLEGINNFNDMVKTIHQYKTAPPKQVNGIADDKGNLSENWYEQFEELRDNPSMKNFKTIEGLAKSLVNANKMVGKKLAPGEFISEEHKKEFYQSLGVPESIDGYELTKPEGHPDDVPYDQNQVDWFANKALEYNLTKEQAQGLRNDFYQLQMEAVKNGQAELENEIAQEREGLKAEWGNDYEKNLELARLVLQKIDGGDVAEELGLDNNPRFAKFMYAISQTMGEDTLISVGKGGGAATIAEIKDNIASLQTHQGYLDPSHPEHKNIHRKIGEYFKQMYPE